LFGNLNSCDKTRGFKMGNEIGLGKNFDTAMFSLREILNKLPETKQFLRLNPILFGKILKGIAINSKHTLTTSEIIYYRDTLIYAFKNWVTEGHKDWIITEIDGLQFTIKFIRKGSEEEKNLKKKLLGSK